MADEAAPAPAPAETAPAAPATTEAPAEQGFVEAALSMLRPHQQGAEAAPQEPAPQEPAPPAEAAKETPPPAEDEEGLKAEEDIRRETAQMPSAQKAAFTKLRYELRDKNRQLKAAVEAQKEQGGERVADPDLTAEVERLRAENESAKAKLSQFDTEFFATKLELTDEYKAQVAAPRDEVAKSIGEIADRYDGVPPEDVISAVKSADPRKIERVTADMSEFDRYRFYQLVDRYQDLARTEQGMRRNAKETLDRIETERRAKTERQTAQEREQWGGALERTWEKLVEDFPVLAPIDGADDWNKQVEKVKAFAAPDRFGKLTVQEKAQSLYRAAAFPVLVSELEQARAELGEARGKLSKYEGASPSLDTSGGSSQEIGGVPVSGDTDIATAMAAMLKKAGLG